MIETEPYENNHNQINEKTQYSKEELETIIKECSYISCKYPLDIEEMKILVNELNALTEEQKQEIQATVDKFKQAYKANCYDPYPTQSIILSLQNNSLKKYPNILNYLSFHLKIWEEEAYNQIMGKFIESFMSQLEQLEIITNEKKNSFKQYTAWCKEDIVSNLITKNEMIDMDKLQILLQDTEDKIGKIELDKKTTLRDNLNKIKNKLSEQTQQDQHESTFYGYQTQYTNKLYNIDYTTFNSIKNICRYIYIEQRDHFFRNHKTDINNNEK